MLTNEMTLVQDTVYFNLTATFLLGVLAVVLLYSPVLGAVLMFALFALMIFNMIVTYSLGLQRGLMASIALTFVYGTYLIYETMIAHAILEVSFAYVAWLFFFPLSSILTGKLSDSVSGYRREADSKRELEKLVTIDAMTGFYNNQGFFRKLDEEFLRAKRYKTSFAVLLFKIANFNELQIIYGDLNAVSILRAVSDKISANTRFSDIKSLIQEDSLSVILPETDEAAGKIVIEKLHHVLDSVAIELHGAKKIIKLKPSMGVGSVRDSDNDVLEMYERAKEELNYDKG